jgi:hypothetical protein
VRCRGFVGGRSRLHTSLHRRCRGGTSGEKTRTGSSGFEPLAHFGNVQMWKTLTFPPCVVGGFASNIKMFPMATLPGWPFAPSRLRAPGLNLKVRTKFEPNSLNNDTLDIDNLSIVLE